MATPTQGHPSVLFLPSRRGIVAAALLTIVVWFGAAFGLVLTAWYLSRVSWLYAAAATTLAGLPVAGVLSFRWLSQALHLRATVGDDLLARRYHGRPDAPATTDAPPAALRPIGTTAKAVADHTGDLLAELLDSPSVRIFRGVGPAPGGGPGRGGEGVAQAVPVSHAVAAGRALVLVESVAWPAGHYELDDDGRVVSDGVWIGQSVAPLMRTAAAWRSILPRSHRVTALVVVHPSADGAVTVAPRRFPDVALVDAVGCHCEIRSALPERPSVSRHTMAALLAAVRTSH
jgi:hypothetical protein